MRTKQQDKEASPAEEFLLTIEAAAELLAVTPETIRAWRYRGVAPAYVKFRVKWELCGITAKISSNTSRSIDVCRPSPLV
jgi:hypothetical protein